MGKRVNLDERELKALYEEQGLSHRQIAEKHGVHRRTIDKIMHRLGIPVRKQEQMDVERICANCGKVTTNPKFCSTSCAAKYNNVHFPKRKKEKQEWICVECGGPTTERRKYCNQCAPSQLNWMDKTIAELSRDGYHQMYRVVRNLARRTFKESGRAFVCAVCDYSEHVEICHIRAISSFDKRTKIREVNRLDNLVALCPNHHWELDKGLIVLKRGGE